MRHEINGEPAYQIYSVGFRFHHAVADLEKVKTYGPAWFEGLPSGRMWNGSSMDWMPREAMAEDAIIAELGPKNLETFRERYPDLDGWQVSVKPLRIETWCLVWFNHYTIDCGQDDLAVLASFERYCNRTQEAIWRGDDKRTLMGAEEHWRWRGEKEGDPAPCRCDGCKKGGLIRINH